MRFGVCDGFVEAVELHKEVCIEPPEFTGLAPFYIKFIDANHCPGSVAIIVRGLNFSYFVSGDMRVSESVIAVAKSLGSSAYDMGFLDSTFYDEAGGWDVIPTIDESIEALIQFLRGSREPVALEFDLLGTEVLLEAVLLEFPREIVAVADDERYDELLLIFRKTPTIRQRLVHCAIEDSPHRFNIVKRNCFLPPRVWRFRASTQRWAKAIRKSPEAAKFPILEENKESLNAFLFFSFHSSRRELDRLIGELNIKNWRRLVKAIEVDPPPVSAATCLEIQERPRSMRCRRRPFDFSHDSAWLQLLTDSQESVMAHEEGDDVILPTWRCNV